MSARSKQHDGCAISIAFAERRRETADRLALGGFPSDLMIGSAASRRRIRKPGKPDRNLHRWRADRLGWRPGRHAARIAPPEGRQSFRRVLRFIRETVSGLLLPRTSARPQPFPYSLKRDVERRDRKDANE